MTPSPSRINDERCNVEIFQKGKPVASIDGKPADVELWVQKVAQLSGQRVDWHYSGGRAHILCLGDHSAVRSAVEELESKLNGRILDLFDEGEPGLYRADVSWKPPGAMTAFDGMFIVQEPPDAS